MFSLPTVSEDTIELFIKLSTEHVSESEVLKTVKKNVIQKKIISLGSNDFQVLCMLEFLIFYNCFYV